MSHELQLPMHSGPPSRHSGSPSSSNYSDSRSEKGHMVNGESPESNPLPPFYSLTHPPTTYAQPQRPSAGQGIRPSVESPYSRSLPPQPPHMDPRYSYGGYPPAAQDSHSHIGHAVEFQNVEIGEKSNKKRRGNLPKHTTDILRAWLHDHLDHAYPNEEQKQHLIRETGLSG
ncbi:MAG: hypothetical protein Q9203_007599, partial [Teloschistes exilis]